jgi:hypothetical protein
LAIPTMAGRALIVLDPFKRRIWRT